jgi:hypothetical protein
LTDSESITITVNEVNVAPDLTSPGDKSVDELDTLSFTLSATDTDIPANTLTYTITSGEVTGMSLVSSTGVFSWTPTEAQGPGSYPVTFQVSDGSLTDSESITITVNEVNVAPVLEAIGDKTIPWAEELTFTATATDYDDPANTLTYSLEGTVPTGASITPGGVFIWTPTGAQVGSHSITIRVTDNGVPNLYDEETISVTVTTHPTTLTYTGDSTEQYSDLTSFSALLLDDGTPISGKVISFTLGSQSTTAITGSDGIASASLAVSQTSGSYTVGTNFAGDTLYEPSSDSDPFTIEKEYATCEMCGDNPVAVRVTTAGGNSGSFTLCVEVEETEPDAPSGSGAPGDIGLAQVTMQLVPVGPGGPISGTASTPDVTGSGYDAVEKVTFSFTNIPVNTYTVQVTVNGAYYTGSCEDVLVVYDPSLGFTTGGGWFYWPGTEDKTNFGFNMKYNKKGQNVQGSLLMIRHLADGTIYRVKSNALYGLALSPMNSDTGYATFAGKSTYQEPGWADPIGNYVFTVYVEDNNEPGTGIDAFWIQVTGGLSMDSPSTTYAEELDGGNIVVPHSSAKN